MGGGLLGPKQVLYQNSTSSSVAFWLNTEYTVHCKKRLAIFSSPAEMSIIKLSLAGNNLIIPGQGKFG
jgi:hypothetical protein